MKNLQTAFKFKGVTDILPPKGEPGDIWMVGRENYVWCGGWQELGGNEPRETVREVVRTPSTCEKCGAPLNPYKIKCEYCGVYYHGASRYVGNIMGEPDRIDIRHLVSY